MIKSRAAVAFGPGQPLQIVEVDVEMEIEENVTMFIDDEDEIIEIETQEDRD